MQKLVDLGYAGYVGHEWIPSVDAIKGLKEAIEICHI
jgi:hydroxypyruvate isomerase